MAGWRVHSGVMERGTAVMFSGCFQDVKGNLYGYKWFILTKFFLLPDLSISGNNSDHQWHGLDLAPQWGSVERLKSWKQEQLKAPCPLCVYLSGWNMIIPRPELFSHGIIPPILTINDIYSIYQSNLILSDLIVSYLHSKIISLNPLIHIRYLHIHMYTHLLHSLTFVIM